ncbi:MAG TPA: tetratricopeptide repeat protein [Steroidobacteraceae bacterium]|jgi:tetratricopeptide (TPR) repeat protein|nr:tetratricopeptide repeat protein [Steroidobacteraceae bacterium]
MANISSKTLAVLILACGLGGALIAASPALAADAPAKQTNSPKVGKILKDVQEDIKNKKYADAITKLKEADGTAGKNAYDQHVINQMFGYCYVRTNDSAGAVRAFEAELDDGFLSPTEQQSTVKALAVSEYTLKNYDKAIEYGQRAIKGGFADNDIKVVVGQSYYLKGDWKNTKTFEEGLVDPIIKGGGTPTKEQLQLILSACVKLDDSACQTRTLEKLVTYYPEADYWQHLLFGLMKDTTSSDANTLEVYRLMAEVDVLTSGDQYTEFAQLALDAGSPGEAQRVLQRGFDKNVFTDQRTKEKNQRLLDKSKQAATTDQAGLDKTAREADAAPTGAKNAGMGLAYFSYGQYDKAVDELNKAVTKGSLRNAPDTQLLLGIAQLKAGHKDEAVTAFKAVKGDPVLERLAALWILHAKQH